MIPTTLTTASSLCSSSAAMILNNNSNNTNTNNNNSNKCNSNNNSNSNSNLANNCGLNKVIGSSGLLTGRGNNSIHANNNNNSCCSSSNSSNSNSNTNSNNVSNSNNLSNLINDMNNSNTSSSTCMSNSILLGIASLILEGRGYTHEDESGDDTDGGNSSIHVRHELALNTAVGLIAVGGGKGEALLMGRQSPKPSTSRASSMEQYHHQQQQKQEVDIKAYIARKLANSPDVAPSYAIDSYNSSSSSSTSCTSSSSSSSCSSSNVSESGSAASSYESNQSRWSQKLSQLRHESPCTFDSKGVGVVTAAYNTTAEEKVIAIERPRANESEYVTSTTLKAAAKDDNDDEDIKIEKDADFEIIRRVPTNRFNYYNNSNTGSLTKSSSAANSANGTIDDNFHQNHLHHSHLSGGSGRGHLGTSSSPTLATSSSSKKSVSYSATSSGTVSGGGLSSLQSLATNTCLRVGTFNASTPKYAVGYKIQPSSYLSHQLGRFQSPSSSSCTTSSLSSFSGQSLAENSSSSTAATIDNALISSRKSQNRLKVATASSPMAVPHNRSNNPATIKSFDKSVGGTAVASLKNQSSGEKGIGGGVDGNNKTELSGVGGSTNARPRQSSNHPQQGPHCVQFLRKMGLMSAIAAGDLEEHSCDISFFHLTCIRWRAYCSKMETILEQGEPICIEVYLGPSSQRILLEQWIITIRDKQPPPTMTLPSLCSAIRSQLYFSQISAWCDLIKKEDQSILETGRLIIDTAATTLNSAAGDLATTKSLSAAVATASASSGLTVTNTPIGGNMLKMNATLASTTGHAVPITSTATTSSSMTPTMSATGTTSLLTSSASVSTEFGSPLSSRRNVRLNVFYRIKQYDSTACFNSKPNVHNFPNVNITENCCVSVCLKSLPRISGGLPPKLEQPNVKQTVRTSKILTVSSGNVKGSESAKHQQLLRQQQEKPLQHMEKMANDKSGQNQTQYCDKLRMKGDLKICSSVANTDTLPTSLAAGISTVFATTAAITAAAATTSFPVATATNTLNALNQKQIKKSRLECRSKLDSEQQQEQITSSTSSILSPSSSNWYNEQDSMLRRGNANSCSTYQQLHNNTKNNGDGDGAKSNHNTISTENRSGGNIEEEILHRNSFEEKEKEQYKNSIAINSSFCGQNFRKRMLKPETEVLTNQFSSQRYQISMPPPVQLMEHDDDNNDNDDNDAVCCNDLVHNDENNERSALNGLGDKLIDDTDQRGQSMSAFYAPKNAPLNSVSGLECLERVIHTDKTNPVQQQIKMISTGTQTVITPTANLLNNCCSVCGNVRTLLCVQCGSARRSFGTVGTMELMGADDSGIDNRISINETMDLEDNTAINHIAEEDKSDVHRMDTKNTTNEEDSLSTCSLSSIDIIHTPRNKAELLLQAIQRTAKLNSKKSRKGNGRPTAASQGVTLKTEFKSNNSTFSSDCQNEDVQMSSIIPHMSFSNNIPSKSTQNIHIQNVESEGKRSDSESGFNIVVDINNDDNDDDINLNSCQGCKRQKTQHDFKETAAKDCAPITPPTIPPNEDTIDLEAVREECYISTTKLTPHIERCSLNNKNIARNCNPNSDDEDNVNESGISGILLTAYGPLGIIEKAEKERGLRSNLHPLLLRHQHVQPKVNLTPLLCNTNPQWMETGSSSSAYVPEGLNKEELPSFVFEPAPVTGKSNFTNSPVAQKSNTSSPSVSPRFLKPSNVTGIGGQAFSKRRSCHLSDRCANDDIFSDDEIEESGVGASCSPSSCSSSNSSNCSPTALKARGGCLDGLVGLGSGNGSYFRYCMSSRPLLGNLEENLLQRRLQPKIEVNGYKLLLGASGGFCPTQLTLPAAAYFYELQGEHLFTPYLCEVRLPRKGYTVPRCGTIQATLLNPMGTVVRMFVIPYDMQDMPALHQTFVRQRIRADNDSHNSTKNSGIDNNNVNNENQHHYNTAAGDQSQSHPQQQQQRDQQRMQAKSLRYSIHLRFQTSRSGRLMLHTDVRVLISRRTDCDTAAAHAKGILEAPNELIIDYIMPEEPKYSARLDQQQQPHRDESLFLTPVAAPTVSTVIHKI